MHELARKLSGLREDKARAIFGGLRLGDIKTRTLSVLRLSKRSPKIKAEIETCLQQFDVIGTQRDKLVHRSVEYDAGKIRITNEITAKSMLEYEQDVLSATDLLTLQIDCLKISIRLSHITNPKLRRAAKKSFLRSLHEPWSYKLVQPEIRKRLTRTQLLAEAVRQRAPSRP